MPVTAASASNVAREAKNSTPLRVLARLGFAVNGLLHVLIGSIALTVALGSGSGSADQTGALGQLASTPGGVFLLWTIAVGLFALGLWLLLGAFLLQRANATRKWAHRAGELGKAVVYFVLAGTAVTFASGGSTSSAQSTRDVTATLLAAPGGVVVLVAAGLVVLTVGAFFIYRGIAQTFTDDIVVPSGGSGRVVTVLGVVGYVAKGIALAVVAGLLLVAAITLDPSQSTGLDGALKTLATLPFGAIILVVVGLGLIAYGLYCFVRARRARL